MHAQEDNEGDANAEPEEEGQATGKDASQPKAKKRTTRSGKVLVSRPKGKGQKQGLKQKRKGAVKEKECGLEGAEAGAEGEGREEEEVCDEGQLLADISQLQALSWAVEQVRVAVYVCLSVCVSVILHRLILPHSF